jgi:hypothetical protein
MAYAFDPTHGRYLGNYLTLNVPYEKLGPGPVGKYLAVVDYDASNDRQYRPVDLDDPEILIGGGLEPSESDPRFHQQMVYAVASETIQRFKVALGRDIRWGFRRPRSRDPLAGRLRIFPHAMQEANAYYDRDLRALVFGYFEASRTDPGVNLPGQTVFTCLSHDIIAHELTHALVDGQRRFFLQPSGPDTPAFHEAFADIVALFQHFSYKEALLDLIQRTGGAIHQLDVSPEATAGRAGPLIQTELTTGNPLVQLARQFGEALGTRAALRSALGTPPNSTTLDTEFEPHARGAILVAAVFDAFFTIYIRRTRDLMRIARAGGALTGPGDLHPDLANRLADEASKTAQHFLNMCIRSLDYCPPVDVQFGDFLRALITADSDLVPDDPYGYRSSLIEAFRLRGIRPEGVTSYAEESLRWCSPEDLKGQAAPPCEGLTFTRPRAARDNTQIARVLHAYGTANASLLGLETDQTIQAHSFHDVYRPDPDGQLQIQMVVELVQRMNVRRDPNDPTSPQFTFRGGTTLIIDEDGTVQYSIQKRLWKDNQDNPRLARQRAYYQQIDEGTAGLTYGGQSAFAGRNSAFSLIHRGY